MKPALGPSLTFREFVKRRRAHLGITQADVALALNVTPDYVSLIEIGLRKLDLDRIPRLATVLEVAAGELAMMALEDQYPLLAEVLGQKTPKATHVFTEIDEAIERLRSLPRDVRRMAINMINVLYDHSSPSIRISRKVA